MIEPRLLIAEDDLALAALLEEYLGGSGYHTTVVHRGDDALALLKKEHFDIILSDIVMPGADGLALLAQNHQDPIRTLVLLMTGYSGIEDAIHAVEQGAYDFISKPFQLPEIRVRLDNAMRYQSLLRQLQYQSSLPVESKSQQFLPYVDKASKPMAIKAYAGNVRAGHV
ncbi:MAG: response regulator [Zetaproteobacteria bacterium CG2_30_46_52]|nr:MAG: response regulator [Zetaproteobacteria bacterium CG2_30_46_52]